MEERIFKQDAKSIVDTAFNAKIFADHLTRDDFNGFEELIAYLLQARYDGYIRATKFLNSIKTINP